MLVVILFYFLLFFFSAGQTQLNQLWPFSLTTWDITEPAVACRSSTPSTSYPGGAQKHAFMCLLHTYHCLSPALLFSSSPPGSPPSWDVRWPPLFYFFYRPDAALQSPSTPCVPVIQPHWTWIDQRGTLKIHGSSPHLLVFVYEVIHKISCICDSILGVMLFSGNEKNENPQMYDTSAKKD